MKNLYISILFIATMLYSTSCSEDFIDLTPQQSLSDSEFLITFDDFEVAMIGGYDQMQNSDWYGRYVPLVSDVMGEDVKQNASANRAKEWAEFNGSSQDFIPEEIWAELYEGINIANRIINSPFEPPAAVQADFNQIVGEAYALRALAHFDLVKMYAQHYTFTAGGSHPGVPIVTEFDQTAKPSRNTVAEVYAQVISDFEMAEQLMTLDNGTGRFSREAVQGLLSRVYLYMENYTQAENYASLVINSGNYSLVPNADYPTQFLDGNSSEAIFEIRFDLVDNPGSDHLGGMYKESGYGDYLPAEDLLDIIPDDDIRKTMFREDLNLGGIYGILRVDKFPSEGSVIGSDNIPVVRLSELYLNRAEARAKLGNDTGAQEDLNMIKQRGWADAPAATATGDALVTEILSERRIELSFEGHRIHDIARNKLDVVRQDCTSTVCTVTYPNARFILPIPIEETDVNPNIAQNPEYGTN